MIGRMAWILLEQKERNERGANMNRYFEMLKHYVISGGQVPQRESRIFTLLTLIVGFLLGYVAIFVGYSGLSAGNLIP